MKAHSALANTLGGLALVLGMTLPAAAQTPPVTAEAPDAAQLAQAQPDAPRPGPRMGERRQGPMHRHGGCTDTRCTASRWPGWRSVTARSWR